MNKSSAIVLSSFAVVLGLALQGAAQAPQAPRPADRPATTAPAPADRPVTTAPRETWRNTQGLHDSATIVGTRVKNAQGKDIGEIDQLLIDPARGAVTHAVIGVGGFLGIGEKQVVVPWSDVKVAMDHAKPGGRPAVTIDQATLERAPRYDPRATSLDRGRASSRTSTR
jgi:sporulation protein YlmC with PRC-barrel domain